jgi:hypothetical protein
MQNADDDLLPLVRARAAARAEIDWYLAAFDASSLPGPKCAALVRAWHALASLDALLMGQSPKSEGAFLESVAGADRRALPEALHDMKEDFAAAVVRCARSEPWIEVRSPGDRELEAHRRVLLGTFEKLNRRVRQRLPRRRMTWWKVAAGVAAVAVLVVPLAVVYRPRWRVAYFPNTTLSGEPGAVRRVLEPDRNWGHYGPGGGLPNDHFSARYETCLVMKRPVNVAFIVGSDDGARLFLDDQLIVDAGGNHAYATRRRGTVVAEGTHALRLEYWQGDGEGRVSFEVRASDTGEDLASALHLPASSGPPCPQ